MYLKQKRSQKAPFLLRTTIQLQRRSGAVLPGLRQGDRRCVATTSTLNPGYVSNAYPQYKGKPDEINSGCVRNHSDGNSFHAGGSNGAPDALSRLITGGRKRPHIHFPERQTFYAPLMRGFFLVVTKQSSHYLTDGTRHADSFPQSHWRAA